MLEQEPARALPRQASLASEDAARRRSLPLALLLSGGVAVLFAGCASVADVTGTASQEDVLQLRTELTTLQQRVQRARPDSDALLSQVDRRLREQSAAAEQQTAALTRRVESLASSLTQLTARIDQLHAQLDLLSRQLRAAAPKPAPPAAAAPAPAPAPARPPAPAPAPTPAPAPAPPATGAGAGPSAPAAPPPSTAAAVSGGTRPPSTEAQQPSDIYQAAYIDFSKGSYPLAIAGFREFLRRYPEHDLADDAQYWVGEANLGQARSYADGGQPERATQALEQAVVEFRKVVANYPRGDKAPTALYKEALALIDLKQPTVAQARLQYLVDNFPQAEEARLARERLASLKNPRASPNRGRRPTRRRRPAPGWSRPSRSLGGPRCWRS